MRLMYALLPVLLGTWTTAKADSVYDRVSEIYRGAANLNMRNFETEQAWAGKCYYRDQRDVAYPVLFDTYLVGEPDDPVLPTRIFFTEHTYDERTASYFLDLDAAGAAQYHSAHERRLTQEWSAPTLSGDPAANEYRFGWREKDRMGRVLSAADYGIRRATDADGMPYYVIKAMCAFRHGCDGGIRYGQDWKFCYVWEQKL